MLSQCLLIKECSQQHIVNEIFLLRKGVNDAIAKYMWWKLLWCSASNLSCCTVNDLDRDRVLLQIRSKITGVLKIWSKRMSVIVIEKLIMCLLCNIGQSVENRCSNVVAKIRGGIALFSFTMIIRNAWWLADQPAKNNCLIQYLDWVP